MQCASYRIGWWIQEHSGLFVGILDVLIRGTVLYRFTHGSSKFGEVQEVNLMSADARMFFRVLAEDRVRRLCRVLESTERSVRAGVGTARTGMRRLLHGGLTSLMKEANDRAGVRTGASGRRNKTVQEKGRSATWPLTVRLQGATTNHRTDASWPFPHKA